MTYIHKTINQDVDIIYIKVTYFDIIKAWLKREALPYRQNNILYFYKENKCEVIKL